MRRFILSKPVLASLLAVSALAAHAQPYQFRVPVATLQVAPALTAEPAFSLSAAALSFGSLTLPATKSLSLVVTNTGNVALAAPAVSTTGTGFSASHSCAESLAVGAACTVASTFAPSMATSYSGTLSIGYAGLSPQTAALSGSGVSGSSSCATVLAASPGSSSGWYTFDPDGEGPTVAQPYYCDMSSDGGGWTRIVRQTEQAPVTNWNGGVNGLSYALSSAQIPAHTQVGFGKDEQATTIDYVTWQYTTDSVTPTVVLTSPKTGKVTYISRLASDFYNNHNPRTGTLNGGCTNEAGAWCQTLAVQQGFAESEWAFSPLNAHPPYRGYAFAGVTRLGNDAFAWTIWVR